MGLRVFQCGFRLGPGLGKGSEGLLTRELLPTTTMIAYDPDIKLVFDARPLFDGKPGIPCK